jgi:hypothetical protein
VPEGSSVQEFYHAMCLITFIIHVKHSNVLIDNTYFSIRMVVAFEEQSIGREIPAYNTWLFDTIGLFVWLISHQTTVLFSHNKSATSNQPAVLFSQNKPAPVISHQPTEQAV